jgi:hypothetical protein
MADTKDFLDYPKGVGALGAGDLLDVVDINIAFTDGEKVISTLRQNPAGSTGGSKSATCTFRTVVSSEGFERDWMGQYRRRKEVQFRLKVPGLVFSVTGRLTNPQLVSNVDNAVEFTITIIGKAAADPV